MYGFGPSHLTSTIVSKDRKYIVGGYCTRPEVWCCGDGLAAPVPLPSSPLVSSPCLTFYLALFRPVLHAKAYTHSVFAELELPIFSSSLGAFVATTSLIRAAIASFTGTTIR